jgi:hypothetical protein
MLKLFRTSNLLPVLAFYLYFSGSAPFLGQWDSFDYLKQIVSHQISALGFGRPAYLGYNMLLWETMKHAFCLDPVQVEAVVMMGTILFGVFGVLLFRRLARHLLSESASRLAAIGLAISPLYVLYSGFIMTEVPMLAVLIASALILWKPSDRHPVWSDVLGGLLFGVAVGIREQALTLAAAFLWILCSRQPGRTHRLRAVLRFAAAAGAAFLMPVLSFYLLDPAGFMERTRTWLHAIPMGHVQFWNNVQASILYTFVICPASWLAVAVAWISARQGRQKKGPSVSGTSIANPALGVFCSVVLPIAALWRDADVQIHPRYALIALPGALIFCAHCYDQWVRCRKGPIVWAVVHLLVFGAAAVALSPYRQGQTQKMECARAVRDAAPGNALLIAGNYSPILDYYRGIGVRPQWQVLWSGWDWNPEVAEETIRRAWADRVPVYLSNDPLGWRYFEMEYLHFHLLFKDCRKEPISPGFYRIYPK